MYKPWTPILYGKNWAIYWVDPLNYAIVNSKYVPIIKKFNAEGRDRGKSPSKYVDGWYTPLFFAIRALLQKEIEDKVLGNPVYNNIETLLLDLREALDKTSKEIEVSL